MDTTMLVTIVVVALVLIVGGLLMVGLARRQRTKRLQEHFGPEYERVVKKAGDQSEAEKELVSRLDHVKSLDIRPLSHEETERFTQAWRTAQAKFIDEPLVALQEADRLIQTVMVAKGYPVEDFERNAADISVDHPDLVTHYRGMHYIAIGKDSKDVGTEEMRQALVHARALFERLLESDVEENIPTHAGVARSEPSPRDERPKKL